MSEPYIYRILKSSWGIWIKIDCEVVAFEDAFQAKPILVSDSLYVSCDQISLKLTEEEISYVVLGIRLVEDVLRNKLNQIPAVIRISLLKIAHTDYQPEGLVYAIAGWLNREYDLNWEPGEVTFNKAENRYVFPF